MGACTIMKLRSMGFTSALVQPLAIVRDVVQLIPALRYFLEIRAKRTEQQMWLESVEEEERIQEAILDAIDARMPDNYISALQRRLRIQAEASMGLERAMGRPPRPEAS